MTKIAKNSKFVDLTLPPDVIASDLKYPGYDSGEEMLRDSGDCGTLTFYETAGFGWRLATLPISKTPRHGGLTARTYGKRISDGAQVRIGHGPHITRTITVYLRTTREEQLKKYIDLYATGLVDANTTRDRISSRRAEGVMKRAQRHRSWRWDV